MKDRLREKIRRLLTGESWRVTLLRLSTLAVAAVAAGLLAAWIGLAPIAASSGHWPLTNWFLHFAMRNSVELRSLATPPPPDLTHPALVRQGAGHYLTACAACHAAPGQPAVLTALQMTPPPPPLMREVDEWRDRELFWIVKHGVKFTAMPAWPGRHRDDEIWAMVAFLRHLPKLTPESWRDQTRFTGQEHHQSAGPIDQLPPNAALGPETRTVLAGCARCHGYDGLSGAHDAFPRLAGQREAYLLATLEAYSEGLRHSGFMQVQAAGLDPAVMKQLARYYASLPTDAAIASSARSNDDAVARGEILARKGNADRGIPACADCHGPARHEHNERYPILAGQPAGYLEGQLTLFAERRRGGTRYAHIMQTIASRLTPGQRADVAAYYQSLAPGSSH